MSSLPITRSAEASERPEWTAHWIAVDGAPARGYGVYHFRRTFDLAVRPAAFPVRVSADNRYELYANGRRVAAGPARGDLAHWRYDAVDLAPYLVAGRNVLAAVVWNYADDAPFAQISDRTAFLLPGDGVDTGPAWKAARDDAYTALPLEPKAILYQYYAAGPGDRIDGAR